MRLRMPRVTLGEMMALVAVVAADIALGRGTRLLDRELPLLCGPPVLLLQAAAWGAWREVRPGRRFWVGYLLLGGLVTAALFWAVIRRPEPAFGTQWKAAIQWARDAVDVAWPASLGAARDAMRFAVSAALVWGPQIGGGVAGGLLGRRLAPRPVALAGPGTDGSDSP